MTLCALLVEEEPEMSAPLKRVIRQEPRVSVRVDALTSHGGETTHEYVVQDDACYTALQVGWLARIHGIYPTKMYGFQRTDRPLNPMLAAYPEVIFNEEALKVE